jgi:hypothetical protein
MTGRNENADRERQRSYCRQRLVSQHRITKPEKARPFQRSLGQWHSVCHPCEINIWLCMPPFNSGWQRQRRTKPEAFTCPGLLPATHLQLRRSDGAPPVNAGNRNRQTTRKVAVSGAAQADQAGSCPS